MNFLYLPLCICQSSYYRSNIASPHSHFPTCPSRYLYISPHPLWSRISRFMQVSVFVAKKTRTRFRFQKWSRSLFTLGPLPTQLHRFMHMNRFYQFQIMGNEFFSSISESWCKLFCAQLGDISSLFLLRNASWVFRQVILFPIVKFSNRSIQYNTIHYNRSRFPLPLTPNPPSFPAHKLF